MASKTQVVAEITFNGHSRSSSSCS